MSRRLFAKPFFKPADTIFTGGKHAANNRSNKMGNKSYNPTSAERTKYDAMSTEAVKAEMDLTVLKAKASNAVYSAMYDAFETNTGLELWEHLRAGNSMPENIARQIKKTNALSNKCKRINVYLFYRNGWQWVA